MPFANGRPYLAIPGPSVMPDAVLRAMHRAAPNIYDGDLIDMTAGIIPDLKRVARTDGFATIYIANGHGVWEAALANVLAPGEQGLAVATGRFGNGWVEMAESLGAQITLLDFGKYDPIDMDQLESALRADMAHAFKVLLITHVDTSTSRRNDIAAIRALLDQVGHPALLMVDCIASLGCDRFEMDAWGVDVMITASQKGLMVPPGVAFVFFNDRAAAQRAKMERVSRYWDWVPRANPDYFYQYFDGTAPTHHLFGLRAALDIIHAEGMDAVWHRHAVLARAIWAACDAWGADGSGGAMHMNIPDAAARSHAVTAAKLDGADGTRLRKWLETNSGVTLGIGLGMADPGTPAADSYFRFGHMGHINAHMVLGMLASVDTGLKALDIAHGAGAIEAATRAIADASKE